MIRSMTGYGTGSAQLDGWRAEVTLRTLNHRYLSLHVRTLHDPLLEQRVEEAVKRAFTRGEIEVTVTLTRDPLQAGGVEFDREVLRAYADELRRISDEFGLPPPRLSDLIALGVLSPAGEESGPSAWPALAAALTQAIHGAQAARAREGELLHEELSRILGELSSLISQVRELIPASLLKLRDRLQERVRALGAEVDPDRLEMEIALLAERADVREEITRLEAHLTRVRELLEKETPVGKELGFLSQELLREANTLGAKARDLEISGLVVSMKVAIDRFREQVQNVE